MPDYRQIEEQCKSLSSISESLVDDFLLYLVAKEENLEKRFVEKIRPYKDIFGKMPESWQDNLMSQFVAHRIFKQDGLASKYMSHPKVENRSSEEKKFFQFQIKHPWRFSFCFLKNRAGDRFFEMEDVVMKEPFLLYSPGLAAILEERNINMFFLLIGFNGQCYQTYGPLSYYTGFQPFDFFCFARQLNSNIDFMSDVQDLVESNPVPFMMLFSCAEYPVTFHKNDPVAHCQSEFHIENFQPDKYKEDFILEEKRPITRMSLKKWNAFPHFSKCLYHSKKNRFIISAMTQRGFDEAIGRLNKRGYEFPLEPDLVATPAMVMAIREILNIKLEVNPYGKVFEKPTSTIEKSRMEKMNIFLGKFMDAWNDGREVDIPTLAKETGVDVQSAEQIALGIVKKLDLL